MAFLTVAGIDLQATAVEELEAERFGSQRRAYSGALRTAIHAERRGWRVTHLEMSKANYEALRAAVALGQHVACSGDGLPAALTCSVSVNGSPYLHKGAAPHMIVPSLTIVEV